MIAYLPAAERAVTRWKNGSGITRVVASAATRHPPGFDWRISIAEIEQPGPFSTYPGVDRTLLVLDGVLELTVGEAPSKRLWADSPKVDFAGESSVFSTPLSGKSTDLNVMVRRGAFRSTLDVLPCDAWAAVRTDSDFALLLALGEMRLEDNEQTRVLGYGDAVRFQAADDLRVEPTQHPTRIVVVGLTRMNP